MSGQMRYISSVTGEIVELDGPITYIGIASGVRARRWMYELEGYDISKVRRQAREESFTAWSACTEYDRMSPIFDADIEAHSPGVLEGLGWRQRAYIPESELESKNRTKCKIKMTAVLLDGVWRKEETFIMRQASGDASGTKIYPYLYPYKYSSEYGVRYLEIVEASPAPFRFVFYGSALNPEVRIGKNKYQFNTSVPEGGHLIVDTLPKPSVTLVDKNGGRSNELRCAVRGTGEGCGEYAFEKIPSGINEVWWSDMFGFDLTVYHTRGDFPCSS